MVRWAGVNWRGARFSRSIGLFWAGTLLCILVAACWRAAQSYPTQLFDFYPLYYGARAWLHGGNAYVLDHVAPAVDHSYSLFRVGNTYPLPAVLLALPFSLLPAKAAAVVWVSSLTLALLLVLRRTGNPYWFLLYLPVLDGLRLEQYTILILVLQLLAYWAYREQRPWVLALCCALILTKPNQALLFVLVLLFLARNWREQFVTSAVVWGATLLLDPRWVADWLPTLQRYRELTHQPILWGLALFAIPLFLARDLIGGAIVLQFLLLPFPIMSTYAVGAVPLTVLHDSRSKWLLPGSFLWPFVALVMGPAWATAITLLLPVTVLAAIRRREEAAKTGLSGHTAVTGV